VEYSTLRELHLSSQNLRICAEEEGRLLGCFWLTQLPPINARGEFYDPKLLDEVSSVYEETYQFHICYSIPPISLHPKMD
jgi:hypothetical protein